MDWKRLSRFYYTPFSPGLFSLFSLHPRVLPYHTTACSLPNSAVNSTKTMVYIWYLISELLNWTTANSNNATKLLSVSRQRINQELIQFSCFENIFQLWGNHRHTPPTLYPNCSPIDAWISKMCNYVNLLLITFITAYSLFFTHPHSEFVKQTSTLISVSYHGTLLNVVIKRWRWWEQATPYTPCWLSMHTCT